MLARRGCHRHPRRRRRRAGGVGAAGPTRGQYGPEDHGEGRCRGPPDRTRPVTSHYPRSPFRIVTHDPSSHPSAATRAVFARITRIPTLPAHLQATNRGSPSRQRPESSLRLDGALPSAEVEVAVVVTAGG